MAEIRDTTEEYDNTHGKPGPDHKPLSEDEQWGQNLNPVRETPLPSKNLQKVGGGE